MTIVLREIGPEDWERLREVRLRALADAPFAFGSTVEEERARPDAWWRERAATRDPDADGFAAVDGDRWVGIVRVFVEPEDRSVAHLVSMWVDPTFRGRGIGRALVERVVGWASEHGAARVDLWVTETNEPAIHLYESCGFARGGGRQPLPSDPSLSEVAMHCALG